VPHGLTHLETSAHILNIDSESSFITGIPSRNLEGVVYLIDLTHIKAEPGASISWQEINRKLNPNPLPFSILAIKTQASLLPMDYDFSGKNFLSLSPEAAKGIHDYRFKINCLLLDLPSIDPEQDGGKLAAHRNYFGLPITGTEGIIDKEKRSLVELAWFHDLKEGYYYCVLTPPRFQTHAVTTGIIFYPLIEN
jgi:kynurenine formamidase